MAAEAPIVTRQKSEPHLNSFENLRLLNWPGGDLATLMSEEQMERSLQNMGSFVNQALPITDPDPALVGEGILVGNKFHAKDVPKLVSLGVTAVLNCASSGIRNLPLNEYSEQNIEYNWTNVAQDAYDYPLLHNRVGVLSEHLEVALALYERVKAEGGTVMFFCVAGQNRSAALAVATLLVTGSALEDVLHTCHESRPFMLENQGFKRQLLELEALLEMHHWPRQSKRLRMGSNNSKTPSQAVTEVAVELTVPGLRTFEVLLPVRCSLAAVKRLLVERVDRLLLESTVPCQVGCSWLIFSLLNSDEFNLVLEREAAETPVQLARLTSTFGLTLVGDHECPDCSVEWTDASRFELVIFSVVQPNSTQQEPFTFRHQERPNAPGTLLAVNCIEPYLRSWDFVTGEAFRSTERIVFSFSEDHTSKRDFMNVSRSKDGQRQQFNAPGEGGILGMGANAIVHHVTLEAVRPHLDDDAVVVPRVLRSQSQDRTSRQRTWDAAVKRQFTLPKMLGALGQQAEAGVARRLRAAGALNRQGRLLYFYGLGIAVASNNDNHDEYRFEAVLLSQFQQEFSTYTLKRFLDDYTTKLSVCDGEELKRIETLQEEFNIIRVKVLLVSLLNAFRDLTLAGVCAFDFNHLNNVLISRDYRHARLIDIDGNNMGSIQFPSAYMTESVERLHKPALEVDLNVLLPLILQQLLFGKGRGKSFVTDTVSRVKRAACKPVDPDEEAKSIIRDVLCENFFPDIADNSSASQSPRQHHSQQAKHLCKVVEWFYAVLMKHSPWTTWTNDIYDAMRCIDHLPIA